MIAYTVWNERKILMKSYDFDFSIVRVSIYSYVKEETFLVYLHDSIKFYLLQIFDM